MNDHEDIRLTPTGETRREQMLDELLGAMQQIQHRRRVRRRVGSALAVLVLFAAMVWVVGSQLSVGDQAIPTIVEYPRGTPMPDVPVSDPPIRPFERTGLVRVVGDDELLTLLAQIDRPAGIVHSEGETWLTSPVTDKELGLMRKPPPNPLTM